MICQWPALTLVSHSSSIGLENLQVLGTLLGLSGYDLRASVSRGKVLPPNQYKQLLGHCQVAVHSPKHAKIKTLNIEYNEIKYRCLVEVWGVIQECIVVEYLASCTMHNMRCN